MSHPKAQSVKIRCFLDMPSLPTSKTITTEHKNLLTDYWQVQLVTGNSDRSLAAHCAQSNDSCEIFRGNNE